MGSQVKTLMRVAAEGSKAILSICVLGWVPKRPRVVKTNGRARTNRRIGKHFLGTAAQGSPGRHPGPAPIRQCRRSPRENLFASAFQVAAKKPVRTDSF